MIYLIESASSTDARSVMGLMLLPGHRPRRGLPVEQVARSQRGRGRSIRPIDMARRRGLPCGWLSAVATTKWRRAYMPASAGFGGLVDSGNMAKELFERTILRK
ncbi:MAG: hypothetical protein BMS9Abin10_0481 [Gammaproteobacteria bacterium]|nr:MAG: hypothetical protein BMS9Abin10_0481 [Gammaproteobacteria bacterium]